MGPTLIFLALVAGIFAVPIQERVEVTDKCATQCTATSQFNYEPGTTYEFEYDTEIRTSLQGSAEDYSGVKMSAIVHMEFTSKCEMTMRLSDVTMMEHDPETSAMKVASSELKTLLERYPLRVSYQDGNIEHICLSGQDPTEILNIKRGILSVFQNNMDDISKSQTVSETDVTGDCEAEYTTGEKGWYNMVIKKSKNLLGCSGRQGAQSSIQGIPYKAQSAVQSLPIVKSTHECEQDLNINSGRLNSATCREQHKFVPFSRGDSGAITQSTQKLTFKSESSVKSKPAPVLATVPLSFQHAYDADRAAKNRKDLERNLMEICESTKSGVRPETPRLFTNLVYTMKTMEAAEMAVVYQKVKNGAICSDNQVRVKKFFLDAIPMTGTLDSLKMMVQLLTSKEVTGIEADMWLTTLAFIQHPTVDMLAQVKNLLSLAENEEKAMLSVSSLVHSYCKTNGGCETALEVRKIISLLENKIGSGCKVTDKNFQSVLLALRAIGNAGYGTSAIPTLAKCISQQANPIEVRLSAIEAFRRIPCTADKRPILDVFANTEEDSEVRIAAYKALMECPTNELLSRIRVALSKEEVNQVGSYVWSHLTNLMETSDPHKQAIKAILEDETLQKEFDMDKRKFSRNYEGSIFLEKINTGATVESDIIWSSQSFIPRSGMFNLTVDLFGNAVNIFEIGGRVEGLEYFLESYFGPNGYFKENDVEAAEETALKTIKPDKVNRIEKRMRGAMDELRGSLYMRVFGNELRYMNFKGIDSLISRDSFNFIDMLMKLSKDNDYTFSQSSMFMDSSIIIPTSSGFPMNLTVNGTATVDVKASGKMDIMKLAANPPSLDINGIIQPSAAIEISSMMAVDAFVTKSGIKMVSTMHSNTIVKGKIELSEGSILNAQWDLPEDRMDIISVKSSFFTMHRDTEREQKMITENRQAVSSCTGDKMAYFTGLELCGELQFPNASLVDAAPYFPLTGPVSMTVSLNKKDTLTGYKFEARSTHDANNNIIRMAFSTPNSKVDRSFGVDLNLNKAAGTFDASITSPWTSGDFKGTMVNERFSKGLTGKLNLDGSTKAAVKALVQSQKSGPGMLYTPTIEITTPNGKDINIGGTVKYAAWKLIDVNLAMRGATNTPISLKGTLMKNLRMIRAAATLSLSKNKDYSFESALQMQTWKKKVIYKPTISIRTPTSELLAVGGGFTNIFGKKMIVDFVMDKVFAKPIILKGAIGKKDYRRNRKLYNIKMDMRSSPVDLKLKTKFDNRNWGTIATDIDLTYVIRRLARNNIKLVSKMINLSSKTLTKAKATMNLAVKRNPELNLKLTGDVNHNMKHSEVDVDIRYGPDFKDDEKQIALAASMDRNLKSLTYASASLNGQFLMGKSLRMVAKADHRHDKRNLDSSLMLRLNKAAIESTLKLADKSKALTNMTGEFNLYYPGRKIAVTQTIDESADHQFTSNMKVRIGKSENSIVTSWKRSSPTALMVSSNVNIQNMEPMKLEGEYSFRPQTYSGKALVSKGKITYSASASTDLQDDAVQLTTDLLYPSRHIVATVDGSRTGDKYTARADLRLNADQDDTDRIVLKGSGNFPSRDNVDGSVTLQYPGRTVALNFKNLAQSKFISHVDFQWEAGKVVSVDTSFGDVSKREIRDITGDLKVRTPFQTLKKLDISLNQQIQASQYVTSMDIEWNPKQIVSTTLSLRRPISLSTINAELLAKTPMRSMKNIQVTLNHRLDDQLSTSVAAKWNKQSAQADISLTKKGESNIKGQIDIKTSFRALDKAEISFNYLNNMKMKSAEIKMVKNKDKYAVSSEMNHNVNGWNIENSGNFKITLPSESFVTEWDHTNTMNDISSGGTMTWRDNRVSMKYNGHQDMAITAGNMRSSLEIQSTFAPMRDIMLTMDHEHRTGLIDSSLKLIKDGSTIATADGQYTRQDGNANGVFRMTNPFGPDDISAKIDSTYKSYPMTGHLEVSASPDLKVVLDGSVTISNGDVDSSLQIETPYSMKPINLKFAKLMDSGDVKTTGSIQLPGKVMSYESRYRNDRIKKVGLILTPPSSVPISAEFEVQGTTEAFRAQGKLNTLPLIGTWSAIGSWDSRNGLSGNVRINTPFKNVSYVQASAESTMNNKDRQGIITLEYMPNKEIKLVSVYRLRDPTDLKATVTLNTPFEIMPYTSFGFSHTGNMQQFNNQAELEYQAGKRLSAESSFSSLNGLLGSAKITSPMTTDISGSFSHTGNLNNFKSHGELTWGKTSAIDLQHESENNNYKTNLDVSCGRDRYEGQMKIETEPKLSAEVALKTPIKKLENTKVAQSFDGTYKQFSTHSEFSNSYMGQYMTDITMNLNSPMSGEISIKTPTKGYRSMRAAFTHEGPINKFSSHVELANGGSQIVGDVRMSTDPTISFEASVQTPVKQFRLSRVSFTHDGSLTNFKSHAELQRNKDISEADLSVSASRKIDVDFKVRSPYMNTLKVSLDHWGSMKKFTTKVRASQGKLKASSDIRFQIQPTFNTLISLKTPFSYLKNQQLSLKHAGGWNSFKCNMQYRCNGKNYIGDASFDNMKDLKGEVNLKGPYFKPVGVLLTHSGSSNNFQSMGAVSYGNKKMQIDASLNSIDDVSGSLSITSPFDAFNTMNIIASHSGSMSNFKTHGELSLDKTRGQLDATFDSTDNIEGTLSLKTPFKGMEDISASITHMGDLQDFNTIARYNQGKKTVEGRIGFNNGPVITGSAAIRSTFPMIKNYEASFRHENGSGKFKTHGELTVAGKRSEGDIEFDSTDGYTGSMTVNSPYMKDTEVVFKHSLTNKALDSNAYVSFGGDKKFNIVTYGSIDPTVTGNLKLETPFSGFETTEMSLNHDGPLNNFRSHAEISFGDNKSEIDVEYSSVSNAMGKLTVKTPLTEDMEASYSYGNIQNNLKASAEASYGRSNSKGDISITYSPDLSAEISVVAPFIKPVELKVEHYGPVSNCRTTAEYMYDGESKFNWNSNLGLQPGDVSGDLTVRTQMPGYRRFGGSLQHSGTLANFKTIGEVFSDESTHKAEVSFSPKEGKLSIDSPLIRPVDGSFTLDGRFPDVRSQGKIDFGSDRLLTVTANLDTKSSIDGDMTLSLPAIDGMETVHIAFTHKGSLRKFDSHCEISYGSTKAEGDVSFNSIDTLEGRIGIQVPNMVPVSYSFKIDGELLNFQSHDEVVIGSDKHELDISFSMGTKIEGSVTVSSPLMKTVSLSFDTTKDLYDLDSNVKMNYDGVKQLGISTSWKLEPISASIIVTTSTDSLITKFNFVGKPTKFQSDAEVTVNGQTTRIDASLNLVDELDGKLEVSAPGMYPANFNFDCDSRMSSYRCTGSLDLQSMNHNAEATVSMDNTKEGSFSLRSPYIGSYSGKASFDGTMQNFRSNAEMAVNEQKASAEATFSTVGDIDARLIVNTPFQGFEANDISFTLSHSGTVKQFRGNAILTVNTERTEISVNYDIQTAMEGSLSVKTPFSKDLDVAFDKSGRKLTASVNYDSETLISTEAAFSKIPLRGNLKLELPFTAYKTVSAAFSHDGSSLKSTNHAEVDVNGEKTEADMSFNFGSKLEGSVSLKSPYFQDITSGFDFSGTSSNFRSHMEAQHGSDKYAIDTTLNSNDDVEAEIVLSTPMKDYRNINGKLTYSGQFPYINGKAQLTANRRNIGIVGVQLTNKNKLSGSATLQSVFTPNIEISFNHQGGILDFASDAELRYNGQSNTASISFRTSPAIEGAVSVSLPAFNADDISSNFKYDGSMEDFKFNGEARLGRQVMASEITFTTLKQIALAASLKTPFSGYEDIQSAFALKEKYKGYDGHMELDLGVTRKSEIDVSYTWRNALKGSISLKSPYSGWKNFKADLTHSGSLPTIRSGLTVSHSDNDYNFGINVEDLTPSNGKVTITTPYKGYENTVMQYNLQGTFPNVYADAKLICASGREVAGTFRNTLSGQKLETKATFMSPYTEDMDFELIHNGPVADFNNMVTLSMGQDNSISLSTSLKAERTALDFDTTISTMLAGYSDEQKASAKFDGSTENFKVSSYLKVLGNEFSVDSSMQSQPSVDWKLTVKTPFENLRDIQASLEHSGNMRRFNSKAEVQYAPNKVLEGTVSYSRYGWRRLQTSVEIRTPFAGFERSSASYIHSASVDSFECNADMTVINKDFSGTLKAAKTPLSSSLVVKTPFENFEDLSASMKLDTESAEASATYMKDKTITVTSEAKLEASPKSALVKITTPFEGFESTELNIEHSGNMKNFQTTASFDTSFTKSMKAQANLQSSSIADFSGSVSFNSEIENFENLKMSVRNRAYQGRYNTRVEASWAPGKEIILDNSLASSSRTQTAKLSMSTPFEVMRQLVYKTDRQFSPTKYQETSSVMYNNKIVSDYDIELNMERGMQLSATARAPYPSELELSGLSENEKYSGKAYVNWNTMRSDSSLRLEGDVDTRRNNAYNIKYQCPTNTIDVSGTLGKSNSKMDVSLNGDHYGYAATYNNNEVKAKLICPTRSVEMFGSSDSKTTEGYFAWDVDRDETKKIGIKSVIVPTGDSMKADISVMMPSIGKDVQLDSEMILSRGRVIFDGKTEFTYSKDSRKKIAFVTRLEDISSSWSVKNYSFSVGISHPFSSVDIQMSSKVGKSDERLTGSIDVEYQTIKRDVKSFKVNGELNKLRKSVSLNVNTPVKKISILGNSRMDAPFRMSLENKYDNRRPLNTVFTLDPTKKSVDFQMNYDLDNPFNEFHVNAKYINSSAVAAEVFHVANRVKVTDAMLALRLNTSHLLHSRIHWRPTALADLKAYANRKSKNYNSRLTSFMDEISTAVRDEIDGKSRLVGDELFRELEPAIVTALEMYEMNEYHVKDITDAVVEALEKMRNDYMIASEKTKEVVDSIVRRIEERLKMYINSVNERINGISDGVGDALTYISKENERLLNHYSERMYNATQHPNVIYLREQYGDYINKLSSFSPSVYASNMADQYTSAMYNARELVNARLAGLGPVVQHGQNAYKYWEIRENTEAVVMAIYNWMIEEIEKELDKLTATIVRFEKSSVTVYDPEHGEIQMELHLPIAIKSLDSVPVVNFVPYVNKAKSYIPSMPSISLPSSDVTTWIPPFAAMAKIEGDKVTTFDGLTYDLTGTCTYVLAKDFVDGNFSLALKRDPETSMIIMADKTTVELLPQGQVRVNNEEVKLPTKIRNIEITSSAGIVKVDGAGNFEVEYDSDRALYIVRLSGWYHGKTSGLFGTFDNEPSNDLMTSYGRPVNNPERFSRTWDIGTARCR